MPARDRLARAHPGARRSVPVELWIEDELGETLVLQRAANLSPAGAVFAHTLAHDPGARVRLRFTLPGESLPVQCEGEVVLAEGDEDDWEVGVRFLDLSPDVRRRIASLVSGSA